MAVDICDFEWGRERSDAADHAFVRADWALITRFSLPSPDRFVREMTTFVADTGGHWRRDDERHDNILVGTAEIPELLEAHGIDARVGTSFGTHQLQAGLHALVGRRREL